MKIDIKNYDLVITTKKGATRLYLNGEEIMGVKTMKYNCCIDELPTLTIDKIVSDKDGKYYLVGGKEVK